MTPDPGAIPDEAAPGDARDPRLITPALLRAWPLPTPSGTKYSRGQTLVIGGAAKTPGGAMLAGLAALRVGAGRLSLAVAESVAAQVAVAIPESGVYGLAQDAAGSVTGEGSAAVLERELGKADGVLVGPGLDAAEGTIRLLEEVAPVLGERAPLVVDAYGFTVLPDVSSACREQLAGRLIATPNATELGRVVGQDELDPDEVPNAALEIAGRYGLVMACSGWVTDGHGVWRISTGDTGLGTSGSGDVLAGAAAGLLSRGAAGVHALVWAAYAHAAAGDRLAATYGRVGYLASELLPELPLVMTSLGGD